MSGERRVRAGGERGHLIDRSLVAGEIVERLSGGGVPDVDNSVC
jgi:hypothetical protein